MLKLLALGAHPELKTIKDRLNDREIELTTSLCCNVEMCIKKNDVQILVKGLDIRDFDFVWIKSNWSSRAVAYAITVYLDHIKIPHTPVEKERSKLVDSMILALEGINVPNTYYSSVSKLLQRFGNMKKICGLPAIVKVTRGSLGNGVYLARDRAEFEEVINSLNKRKTYICQEYIPNDFDYRIIVANKSEILSGERRVRKENEFRNNAHLGADEFFMSKSEVPEPVCTLAAQSAMALDLNWTGIDIVNSNYDGQNYVLELNRRPGLTENSTETKAAFDYILDLLEKEGLYVES